MDKNTEIIRSRNRTSTPPQKRKNTEQNKRDRERGGGEPDCVAAFTSTCFTVVAVGRSCKSHHRHTFTENPSLLCHESTRLRSKKENAMVLTKLSLSLFLRLPPRRTATAGCWQLRSEQTSFVYGTLYRHNMLLGFERARLTYTNVDREATPARRGIEEAHREKTPACSKGGGPTRRVDWNTHTQTHARARKNADEVGERPHPRKKKQRKNRREITALKRQKTKTEEHRNGRQEEKKAPVHGGETLREREMSCS